MRSKRKRIKTMFLMKKKMLTTLIWFINSLFNYIAFLAPDRFSANSPERRSTKLNWVDVRLNFFQCIYKLQLWCCEYCKIVVQWWRIMFEDWKLHRATVTLKFFSWYFVSNFLIVLAKYLKENNFNNSATLWMQWVNLLNFYLSLFPNL